MDRLETGHRTENYQERAHQLPDEAAFVRKIFERGNFRISVDCGKLKEYVDINVSNPELKIKMSGRLDFIMMEMDPALRPQALVQFFQQYYAQFSGNADLQRMIDFILDYEAMEGFALLISPVI